MDSREIIIVDCTLRDGEQAAGVFFSRQEKFLIASLLDLAGVRIIDAGMPSVSEAERATLRALREHGFRASIAGTVRASHRDVDLATACGLDEVFLFMPVSPEHLRYKFGVTLSQAVPEIEKVVTYAVKRGLTVHFVAEDTVRASAAEVARLFGRVYALGASSAMICDTVGIMSPGRLSSFIQTVRDNLQFAVPLGIHCHNDYGLAVANTLSAVEAGCTIVSGTINGLGERAGNAALEEIICAIEDLSQRNVSFDRSILPELCRMVARASGIFIPPTKPIVGLNAFRHESGVHVHAMLRNTNTYEAIDPSALGHSHEFVLGKHSGRALVEKLLASKGIQASTETVCRILNRVKDAKTSCDKTPYTAIADQLESFWATHLTFSEREFWDIAWHELSFENAAEPEGPITRTLGAACQSTPEL